MPHIYEEGRVSVHIPNGELEPAAYCFDLHDEEMNTVVIIDLFTFLPLRYSRAGEENQLPAWQFVVEAMRSCADHDEQLWRA